MPDMIYVDSSNIESIGYDSSTGELYVSFLKSGTYVFRNVPEEVFHSLLNAPSKGSYFNLFVKPMYTDYGKM